MAKKAERAEMSCSFCSARFPSKLIAGPAIVICRECVERSAELARAGNTVVQPSANPIVVQGVRSGGLFGLFRKRPRPVPVVPTCSFCGKAAQDLVQPPSDLGTHALICGECRTLCQEWFLEVSGRTR